MVVSFQLQPLGYNVVQSPNRTIISRRVDISIHRTATASSSREQFGVNTSRRLEVITPTACHWRIQGAMPPNVRRKFLFCKKLHILGQIGQLRIMQNEISVQLQ